MNYINQLRAENESLKTEITALKEGLDDLKRYLSLSKFSCGDPKDGYVNIQDIFLRLREIENYALNKKDEAFNQFINFFEVKTPKMALDKTP